MGRPRVRPVIEISAKICACGCGQTFYPVPVPISMKNGGGVYITTMMRGHDPESRKTQNIAGWNRGLKKGDHPSLSRMGFQPGHATFSDWGHVNEKLRNDPEVRAKWLASKKGQVAWNAGLTADTHPDRVPKQEAHWNWRGNPNGIRETYEYKALRTATFRRDDYTCKECGDRGGKGRGVSVRLHMHHVTAVCHNPSLVLDPDNVITLCEACHRKTDTFGPAALKQLKKLRSDTSGS